MAVVGGDREQGSRPQARHELLERLEDAARRVRRIGRGGPGRVAGGVDGVEVGEHEPALDLGRQPERIAGVRERHHVRTGQRVLRERRGGVQGVLEGGRVDAAAAQALHVRLAEVVERRRVDAEAAGRVAGPRIQQRPDQPVHRLVVLEPLVQAGRSHRVAAAQRGDVRRGGGRELRRQPHDVAVAEQAPRERLVGEVRQAVPAERVRQYQHDALVRRLQAGQ